MFTLELECGEPISGSLADGHGTKLPFTGWLGLASALQTVVGHSAAHEVSPPPAPTSGPPTAP